MRHESETLKYERQTLISIKDENFRIKEAITDLKGTSKNYQEGQEALINDLKSELNERRDDVVRLKEAKEREYRKLKERLEEDFRRRVEKYEYEYEKVKGDL